MDYGTAWRILRVPSLTDQIFIKAQRIRTLQQVGESKVGEGVRPELIGIINYAAMALVQLDLGVVDTPDLDAGAAVAVVKERLDRARDLMQRKNHDYGEAWRSMRVSSLVDLILMKLLRIKSIEDNQGKTVAVFCHGGVINVWTCHVLGMAPRLFFEPHYTSIHRYLCARTGQRKWHFQTTHHGLWDYDLPAQPALVPVPVFHVLVHVLEEEDAK